MGEGPDVMPVELTQLKRPVSAYLRDNPHYTFAGFNFPPITAKRLISRESSTGHGLQSGFGWMASMLLAVRLFSSANADLCYEYLLSHRHVFPFASILVRII